MFRKKFSNNLELKGNSRQRLYDDLGLMSLCKKPWYNKLIFFYRIANGLRPDYFQSLIDLPSEGIYPLRSVSAGKLKLILSLSKSFEKSLFPYFIE